MDDPMARAAAAARVARLMERSRRLIEESRELEVLTRELMRSSWARLERTDVSTESPSRWARSRTSER
jgi:hypothetical protein